MKLFTNILKALGILILLAIITGIIFIVDLKKRAVPDYAADIEIPGLEREVTVYRDSLGVPHVYAHNEHDLYLSTGYLVAQDRLWQMDLLRRVTQGRLSEIFGSDFIETDALLRALRYDKKSKMVLDSASSELRLALHAFADGVNLYIENNTDFPPEFAILGYRPEPWNPVHTLNLIGYMAWDLKAGWSQMVLNDLKGNIDNKLYQELLPDPETQNSYVYPEYDSASSAMISMLQENTNKLSELGLDIFNASNNWAVSGKKSTTGKPVLANDMHLSFGMPGIWYQMHQVIEGSLNVTGLLLPGQPFIIVGHNDSIAWGMTNTYVDNLDFYEEKVNPVDSSSYYFNGKWIDFQVEKTKIATKAGDTVTRILEWTHRGPVISDFKNIPDRTISMRWVGDEYSNEPQTVYSLNRADNWEEFTSALRTFKAISQNINYADVAGNIGMYTAAGVPVRKRDTGFSILPGDTSLYDWQGMVPFDSLPNMYNPAKEYVSSANNRTAPDDYPYYIGQWYALPHRFNRINELLEAKEKHSLHSFKKIQTDYVSTLVRQVKPRLMQVLNQTSFEDSLTNRAIAILSSWDGYMGEDLAAPLIFEEFYLTFLEKTLADEMGLKLFDKYTQSGSLSKYAFDNIWRTPGSDWFDDVQTPEVKEDFNTIVTQAFRKTINSIAESQGKNTNEWKWGNVHTLTLQHPMGEVAALEKIFKLNRGPFPVPGSYHTVSPYSYSFSNPYQVTHGSSHRHIYSLANWDSSFTVIPTGNSGVPGSEFYGNQTPLFLDHIYHRDYYSREAVESAAKYVIKLKPSDNEGE